ncbi:hypothetical protein VTK73DRAFT_5895 [Phialemonium thermophilum]|uniref:PH-response regulator protein palH/prr-4 n=1 Tax=Phialemonium thermophilum TaxID=223376 RepID=A0ABR3XWX3_9PEZI
MEERQFFGGLAPSPSRQPSPTSSLHGCPSFTLPAGDRLSLANGQVLTVAEPATYRPACTASVLPIIIANGGGNLDIEEATDNSNSVIDLPTRDPFYASTFPQCYALAATTVIAYTLVIMLFITPRSFLQGGVVVLGRRGFTNGGTGGTNIGGRPWLQKVAALTVAISLTIASANTFRVAEDQYAKGFQNAQNLQSEVLGGTELKVIRIISDTFLWLAQAQTLIRLFPRQREKVIIKYTAFALITLDLIFQCLNSFRYTNQGNTRPRSFTDAVPALSYLFQLSLGVLYAAWVIYYALMKKRYAFYHAQMKNMCLVSVLSLLAILVPVVFFVLDISKPDFTGWGDYVRWVGAAAASVIVWEWVERIEALEREEKKDGILGREVFDGDEMLEITRSDFTWPRRRKKRSKDGSDFDDGEGGGQSRPDVQPSVRGNVWPAVSSLATKYGFRSQGRNVDEAVATGTTQPTNHDRIRFLQPPLWPARPAPAVTPVSRTDSASAASTVYAVRYHPLTETTSRTTPPPPPAPPLSRSTSIASSHRSDSNSVGRQEAPPSELSGHSRPDSGWRTIAQGLPFPRISRGDSLDQPRPQVEKDTGLEQNSRWDIRARFEDFAATQAERLRGKIRPSVDTDSLPVMVIPAPPRRGAALAQLLEEEEAEPPQGASCERESQSPPPHLRHGSPPTTFVGRNEQGASSPIGPGGAVAAVSSGYIPGDASSCSRSVNRCTPPPTSAHAGGPTTPDHRVTAQPLHADLGRQITTDDSRG